MPLDGFGEIYEITAAVLPEYRRQGIFKQLYEAAQSRARILKACKLLVVNYRESPSGVAAVKAMQLPYDVSEYHMAAENPQLPASALQRLQLRSVEVKDLPKFEEMLSINFGKSDMHLQERLEDSLRRMEEPYYFAILIDHKEDKEAEDNEAKAIGHIGAMIGKEGVYIRAVGILPEWRQQGYGHELLAAVVRKLSAEGNSRFELDVATSNAGALTLYESCGFTIANVYDYHVVPLQ